MASVEVTFHPFPRLPAEVRCMIWSMNLDDDGPCLYFSRDYIKLIEKTQFSVYRSQYKMMDEAPDVPSWVSILDYKMKHIYHAIPFNQQQDIKVDLRHTMLIINDFYFAAVGRTNWFEMLQGYFQMRHPAEAGTAAFANLLRNITQLGLQLNPFNIQPISRKEGQFWGQLESLRTVFIIPVYMHPVLIPAEKIQRGCFVSFEDLEAAAEPSRPTLDSHHWRTYVGKCEDIKHQLTRIFREHGRDITVKMMVNCTRLSKVYSS